MIKNKFKERSFRLNQRSNIETHFPRSFKPNVLQKIAAMLGLMCLVSCYITLKVLEGEQTTGKMFGAHDLHAAMQQQKMDLINRVNHKENLIPKKRNTKNFVNIIKEEKRIMKKDNTIEQLEPDAVNDVDPKEDMSPKKQNKKDPNTSTKRANEIMDNNEEELNKNHQNNNHLSSKEIKQPQPQQQNNTLQQQHQRNPPKKQDNDTTNSTVKKQPNDFNINNNNETEAKLENKNNDEWKKSFYVDRLPMSQTPALIGASKAKIKCEANVDSLAYWNDPQGTQDINFKSPFIGENPSGETKYLSFAPDIGGWNNIRMSLEIVIILAAVTGRTLILPPNKALYLLDADKGKNTRNFADFFPLHKPEFLKKVPIISTEEFIEREGKENGKFPIPKELQVKVHNAKKECFQMQKAMNSCFAVHDYFASIGNTPDISNKKCLIFDENKFNGSSPSDENQEKIKKFCGDQSILYFTQELQQETIIHLRNQVDFRLLAHFYGMMLFTDPVIDNHYKRFVRDFLHYHDVIFCAAGKIVNSLEDMAKERKLSVNSTGVGGFSTMHVRRGDFQFRETKISAEEWNNNLHEIWLENEILYIATDEKNKTFFDALAKNHTLKFLDDFWDSAGLGDLDPNYMGMIDTIVASRGRTFSGTWFSTFTGYINRMRGYHGMSMNSTYYGYSQRKLASHTWRDFVTADTYQFEWPTGWIGIDGDAVPIRNSF